MISSPCMIFSVHLAKGICKTVPFVKSIGIKPISNGRIRWIVNGKWTEYTSISFDDSTPIGPRSDWLSRWVKKWLRRFRETAQQSLEMFKSRARAAKTRRRQNVDEGRDVILSLRDALKAVYGRVVGPKTILVSPPPR